MALLEVLVYRWEGHEEFLNITTAFLHIYLGTAKEQEAAFQLTVSAHGS